MFENIIMKDNNISQLQLIKENSASSQLYSRNIKIFSRRILSFNSLETNFFSVLKNHAEIFSTRSNILFVVLRMNL
jgi:hypothetical protein